MTAKEFTAWRAALGLSQQAAADSLGIHLTTVQRYERSIPIPVAISLACQALKIRDLFVEKSA